MGLKRCDVCAKAPFVNEYHAAAVHTKAYHDLLVKIHEKIDEWEKLPHPYLEVSIQSVTEEFKSLLEDEK